MQLGGGFGIVGPAEQQHRAFHLVELSHGVEGEKIAPPGRQLLGSDLLRCFRREVGLVLPHHIADDGQGLGGRTLPDNLVHCFLALVGSLHGHGVQLFGFQPRYLLLKQRLFAREAVAGHRHHEGGRQWLARGEQRHIGPFAVANYPDAANVYLNARAQKVHTGLHIAHQHGRGGQR